MDVVLVLLALCAVLLTIRLVRARRRRDPATPDAARPADARGAVDRHSRLPGSGGTGG